MVKFWLERFVEEILKNGKEKYVVSGGMAVSGPIHIGKLRGEVIYPSIITRILRKNYSKEVKHIVIIYTQDPLKAKEPLVTKKFIEEWKGVRILNVEDPNKCHKNWVEHFYEPYELSYSEYGITAEPIMTHEIYENNERMKNAIKTFLEKRNEAREVLNKYKGEKLDEKWMPLKPLCEKCYNILTTRVIRYEGSEKITYECNKCGHIGETYINKGKLEWRAEWVSLWYTFNVDVELYGKDHAAAGGSRDSCNELIKRIFNLEPPKGMPYEWVELIKEGKKEPMGSSEGVTFNIDEWLRVGKPQVLKYWYLIMKAKTHLEFDPSVTIPYLHEEYDKAERIYFGLEEPPNKELEYDIKFSYVASNDFNPPKEIGIQVPYSLLAIIVQIVPKHDKVNETIKKLKKIGYITKDIKEEDIKNLSEYIEKISYWVNTYAPPNMKIKLSKEFDKEFLAKFSDKEINLIKEIITVLNEWDEKDQRNLEIALYNVIRKHSFSPKEGFYLLYKLVLNKESGPKFVSLVQALGKNEIINVLKESLKQINA